MTVAVRQSRLLAVCLFASTCCAWSRPAVGASEDTATVPQAVGLENGSPSVEVAPADFDYRITNGYYATITAFSFDEPKLLGENEVKLKGIPGFEKDLKVRVMWQNQPARLAVLLLGLGSRSKNKIAQLWKQQMFDAGCHVVTFDSPFLPAFNERSRHGVPGYVREEARLSAQIVNTLVQLKDNKDKVTGVVLLGASYGGIMALNWMDLAQSGEVPLRPEAILAVSPPVNMHSAARRLDDFYRRYRWNYTLAKLGGDLLDHQPVGPGEAIPFTDEEMMAGIAAAFRLDLKEVIDYADSRYKLGQLPSASQHSDQYRRDMASTWSFESYIHRMVYRYWNEKGVVRTIDDLWASGDTVQLMSRMPKSVRLIIAADDPLNEPSELDRLRALAPSEQLTVLPYGGHMGFTKTEWLKKQVQAVCRCGAATKD